MTTWLDTAIAAEGGAPIATVKPRAGRRRGRCALLYREPAGAVEITAAEARFAIDTGVDVVCQQDDESSEPRWWKADR